VAVSAVRRAGYELLFGGAEQLRDAVALALGQWGSLLGELGGREPAAFSAGVAVGAAAAVRVAVWAPAFTFGAECTVATAPGELIAAVDAFGCPGSVRPGGSVAGAAAQAILPGRHLPFGSFVEPVAAVPDALVVDHVDRLWVATAALGVSEHGHVPSPLPACASHCSTSVRR
jgi:hypothetical protein